MPLTKFTLYLSDHGELLKVKPETGYAGDIPSISVRKTPTGYIADVVEASFVDALILANRTNHLSISDQCLALAYVDLLLKSSDDVVHLPKKILADLRGMVVTPLDYVRGDQ